MSGNKGGVGKLLSNENRRQLNDDEFYKLLRTNGVKFDNGGNLVFDTRPDAAHARAAAKLKTKALTKAAAAAAAAEAQRLRDDAAAAEAQRLRGAAQALTGDGALSDRFQQLGLNPPKTFGGKSKRKKSSSKKLRKNRRVNKTRRYRK